MNDHTDPLDVAHRLLQFAARVEAVELTVSDDPGSYDEQETLRHAFGMVDRYAGPAKEMIGSLQEALEDTDWDPDVSDIPQTERDQWTFGTAINFRGAQRPILRGFIQPLRREPVLRRVPDRVARYLITEPHRVCRRPFRLSYAAMAASSSMA